MWWTAQLVVRALYDFDRRQDDDIDFRKGDRMVVVNKTYVRQLTHTHTHTHTHARTHARTHTHTHTHTTPI